jgi:hypothetical protein
MPKKNAEKIVSQVKQEPETPFPKKPKDEFVALRKWLDENEDRDVMTIIEDDRKLIYGKMREKALGGHIEALKAVFNKMFPDMKIERKEEHLSARQLIEIYVRLYPQSDTETNARLENKSNDSGG